MVTEKMIKPAEFLCVVVFKLKINCQTIAGNDNQDNHWGEKHCKL